MQLRWVIFWAFLTGALFAGWNQSINSPASGAPYSPNDRKDIEATIEIYNDIFAGLYVTDGDPKSLNILPAETGLRHEIFKDLGFLRANKMVLVLDKATSTLMNVTAHPGGMVNATVFEEWNYTYRRSDTNKTVQSVKGLGEGFVYKLKRRGPIWMIVDIMPTTVSNAPALLEDSGF